MSKGRLGIVAGLAGIALVAGVAGAAIPDAGGVFHACIKKTIADDGTPRGKGELRIVDHGAGEECKPDNEMHIHFNEKGQKGDKGDTGAKGDAGAKGDTGAQGPAGSPGLTGFGRPFSSAVVDRGVDVPSPGGGTLDGDVGRHIDIAIGSDDLPLISYYDPGENDLRVAHCSNAACTAATRTTLDSEGDVGKYTSIGIGADGLGLIAYYDETNDDLKVAHCTNVACTSAATTTVDNSIGEALELFADERVSPPVALAIGADGRGLIAYRDGTPEPIGDVAGRLKVAHCTDATCSTSTKTLLETGGVDDSGVVVELTGLSLSITVGADGFGLIAFFRKNLATDRNQLRIAHCTDVACTSASISSADISFGSFRPTGPTAIGFNGAVESPFAYVVFHLRSTDSTTIAVYRCVDTACSQGSPTGQVESGLTSTPHALSVAVDRRGLPLVAYAQDTLQVAHCWRSACERGASIQTADEIGSGASLALAIDRDGFPVVAYHDLSVETGRGELRVVR